MTNHTPWNDHIADTDVRVWYEPIPRIWLWSIGDEDEPTDTGFALTREQAILDSLDILDEHLTAA